MDTGIPAHVPQDRVVDVDIYAPPLIGEIGFHRAWAKLQGESPGVVWTPRNEGHWIALSGQALHDVQSDPERFSSRIIVLPRSVGEVHGLIPTTIDPPAHRPYRTLLNANLNPATVRGLGDSIRQTAIDLIEGFRAEGRCDFTTEYAEVFPIRVFMAMVGLPESEAPTIRHWASCMTRPGMDMTFEEAKAAFFERLAPVVDERRAHPGEDMLSNMMAALMDQPEGGEPRRLTRDEALKLSTQVLIAGVDTVVNFLGFVMAELAQNPPLRAQLAAMEGNLMPAVNELFRRFGLVTIAREVRHDIADFHGVSLKGGDMICIPTQVHGLDESLNPDPLALDFARRRAPHSAFGSGPHLCPGQELARKEVAVTLEEWLRRIPDFSLGADADLSPVPGIVGALRRVTLAWAD
ncbi:cytochrome P450 [Novosphingobium sp. KCTC 2891]|uniref:cytochrome P450 n=1 Tax=Novosphingobium sp. KCTC 2891 TaxID=2989730 RepID=UPI00222393AB|nr:cytochrome P450 [Novosphingobium sp. KCTC 2891]MCW1382548.1 cytochrome P450 [Novosphingobium sp. KCTC 2891]